MTVHAHLLDRNEVIISSKFGTESLPLEEVNAEGQHRFIKACLLECPVPQGIEIHVHSDFEHTVGLGSSAAVVAATLGALLQVTKGIVDKRECALLSQKVIRSVQGDGSGADAAASIFGGVLLFYKEGCIIRRVADTLPLYLAYSGMKTPTQEVIELMRKKEASFPQEFQNIFLKINSITQEALKAIETHDLQQLGTCLNKAHEQMVLLGLENEPLATLRKKIIQDPNILGCKISGSGLGDCLVLLAKELSDDTKTACLSLFPDSRGLETETYNRSLA
jgi:mevalonate kinase